ncbi:hypothetical protein [Streptomyces sp. NPDC029721]|uniref:hypothetical protein n=1 Tax=Streptomyces sp. NPDC029721 TaxID=3157090 RepID=UPI0034046420
MSQSSTAWSQEEQWLGEIEGIDLTLSFLRGKQAGPNPPAPVDLGLPLPRAVRGG